MYKTLRISFSLKNTYRVNSILYAIKQIPLIKKILPDALYGVRGLKIFANIISVIWEIVTFFIGKLLYFITMVCGIGLLYKNAPADQAFLHILLFLTIIGAYMNTSMFDPTRDKYYAMILLRMNAREYTLVNYGYSILKVIFGFLPFSILFGMMRDVPLWFCILIPFSVAGLKLAVAAYSLWDYERSGFVYNENKIRKHLWIFAAVLLAFAYVLPAAGIVLPASVSMAVMLLFIPLGILSIRKIVSFGYYREVNQELLSQVTNQMDAVKQAARTASDKSISTDASITSKRRGFEYLNELFIKRHRKILWKSTKRIAAICFFLSCAAIIALYMVPEARKDINEMMLIWLPYFTFIMYAINRGTGFTKALFMNCDHSLLTYSFYKQPAYILKLFRIRLREIMKVNALPAIVIGAGLSAILYVSGGTENPLNYAVLFISILCMSMFFSIHYLTIYYLLQPYNAGTEIKSGMYQIIMSATYLVCFGLMQVRLPILVFGIACIAFCIVYSAVACVLVYRFCAENISSESLTSRDHLCQIILLFYITYIYEVNTYYS